MFYFEVSLCVTNVATKLGVQAIGFPILIHCLFLLFLPGNISEVMPAIVKL